MIPVRVEGVAKRFGAVEALRGVTLEFGAGKLTAILGPSGCGKTTLLRAIAGFAAVDSGRIFFASDDVTARPPQARETAMVFQNYALWPHMSVFDNVAYGLRRKRVPSADIRRRVLAALDLVEIGDAAGIAARKPGALSGGQQQRVALARALVVEPRVLLLDEPLSNLDAKVRQRLRVEVRRLQRRIATTMIYVTHDQEEALAIADRVVLMHGGHRIFSGCRTGSMARPRTAACAWAIRPWPTTGLCAGRCSPSCARPTCLSMPRLSPGWAPRSRACSRKASSWARTTVTTFGWATPCSSPTAHPRWRPGG